MGKALENGSRPEGISKWSHTCDSNHWFAMTCSSLGKRAKKEQILSYLLYGAGDEARTRYLHLGKVALYQMSYARNGHGLL